MDYIKYTNYERVQPYIIQPKTSCSQRAKHHDNIRLEAEAITADEKVLLSICKKYGRFWCKIKAYRSVSVMLPNAEFFDLFTGRPIEPENKLAYGIMDLKVWNGIDKDIIDRAEPTFLEMI